MLPKSRSYDEREHAPSPQREPEIMLQGALLERNVAALQEVVEAIGARLTPVMRQEPKLREEKAIDRPQPSAPLAAALHRSNLGIEGVAEHLKALLSLLEV